MFNINKYKEIREKIEKNNISCDIIAISKNHPKESVITAIKAGVRIFGENRVMEAKDKFEDLKQTIPDIQLHLTGPLQSNKIKHAIKIFDVFHTLDREKIAREFSKHHAALNNKQFYIQVNTGKEKSKSGIFPEDIQNFLKLCQEDLKLNISGLMCIPPIQDKPSFHFNLLKKLANENNR